MCTYPGWGEKGQVVPTTLEVDLSDLPGSLDSHVCTPTPKYTADQQTGILFLG